MMLQNWTASTLSEPGDNKVFANLVVKLHLAFWKFHYLKGMLGTEKANLGGVISKGQCCDLGKALRTRLSVGNCKDLR